MTTTFQLDHGAAAMGTLRIAMDERIHEALQLPRDLLALFVGAGSASLRRLLDAMVVAGAPGTMTLHQFGTFASEMCIGANGMQAQQLHDLVVFFRQAPAALTAANIAALLRAQVAHPTAPVTHAEAATTLLALSAALTPAQLHALVTVSMGNYQNQVIPPSYLRGAIALIHEYDGVSFATRLAAAMALTNGLGNARALLARLAGLGVPSSYAGELLHVLGAITPDRFLKLNNFVTAANALVTAASPWGTHIMRPLRWFRDAQRAPFGLAPTPPFGNTAFPLTANGLQKAMAGGTLLWAPDEHINYFCNSHTFAHCDFAERIARNTDIDFWPPTYTKAHVEALFTGMTVAQLQVHVNGAHPTAHVARPYFSQAVLNTEVGVGLSGAAHTQYYAVRHLAPGTATYRVSNGVLRALQRLM